MRRRTARLFLRIVASNLIWAASTAYACELPGGWDVMTPESEQTAVKTILFLANGRAPVSKPFDIKFRICDGPPPDTNRISVDAIMPKHLHGMNYTPEVERLPDGSFVARRLVFHMPGDWRIRISAPSGEDATRHFLDVVAKGR